MADKTNLDGHKQKAAMDEFAEVGFSQRKNRLEETLTKRRTLMNLGWYFIALILPVLFLIMCTSRRLQGRNFGSQGFADQSALICLE
jgi:hypothetical protein